MQLSPTIYIHIYSNAWNDSSAILSHFPACILPGNRVGFNSDRAVDVLRMISFLCAEGKPLRDLSFTLADNQNRRAMSRASKAEEARLGEPKDKVERREYNESGQRSSERRRGKVKSPGILRKNVSGEVDTG